MKDEVNTMRTSLPEGFHIDEDQDGDWILSPPEDITIFSLPGEGVLLGNLKKEKALVEALEFLSIFTDEELQERCSDQELQEARRMMSR